MTKHIFSAKHLETPIGKVISNLYSNNDLFEVIGSKKYNNGYSITIKTFSHSIELIEFKIKTPLYNGETIQDSRGWIWRIKKTTEDIEDLELNCMLTDFSDDIEFDTASGEALDAIVACNDDWVLHIGTEDGEIMQSRAIYDNWFPNRLKDIISVEQPATHIDNNRLFTPIPKLLKGECLHIQYLSAYDRYNVNSVNTWLAVDGDKGSLETWVGIDKI